MEYGAAEEFPELHHDPITPVENGRGARPIRVG